MRVDKTALAALTKLVGNEDRARSIIEDRIRTLICEATESLLTMHECERMSDRRKRWRESCDSYHDSMKILIEFIGDKDEAIKLVCAGKEMN